MDNVDTLFNLEPITPRELVEPQDLGSTRKPEEDGFSVRVSDSPIAMPIESGDDTPRELRQWTSRFALWAIPHRIAIVRVRGSREVMSCGIDVEFDAGKKTCSVVSLFPTPQHIVRLHGTLALSAAGKLTASGQIEADPDSNGNAASSESPSAQIGGALKVEGAFGIRFATRLCTPYVSAAGVGSKHCEFRFDHESEPLYGRDIECWSIVALSKQVRVLKMDLRYYIVTREVFISRRYEGSRRDLEVSL
jgi:hypothetical protein